MAKGKKNKKNDALAKAQKKKYEKITKKQDEILKIVAVILFLIAVFLIISRIVFGKNLSPENRVIKDVYNYLMPEDLNNCNGLVNYTDGEVTYTSIHDDIKLCLAYQKVDLKNSKIEKYDKEKKDETCHVDDMIFKIDEGTTNCKVTKIKKETLENTYQKIFGEKIKSKESFYYDNSHICYLKDNYYYCGLSETYTFTIGDKSTIYRIIDKAVEKSGVLTIYDYFLMMNNDTCYKYYTPANENTDCTDNYKKNKINFEFMKKYGTQYIHTYKKDKNGVYYWVSSTPNLEDKNNSSDDNDK